MDKMDKLYQGRSFGGRAHLGLWIKNRQIQSCDSEQFPFRPHFANNVNVIITANPLFGFIILDCRSF